MAALTTERPESIKWGGTDTISLRVIPMGVAAATKIYAGAIVVKNAAGYAAPGTTATGLIAAGRAEYTVDNSTGANGDKTIEVRAGVFEFNNATGGDAVLQANLFTDVYIMDDNTVTITATGRSVAGKFMGFGSNGADTTKCWVRLSPA